MRTKSIFRWAGAMFAGSVLLLATPAAFAGGRAEGGGGGGSDSHLKGPAINGELSVSLVPGEAGYFPHIVGYLNDGVCAGKELTAPVPIDIEYTGTDEEFIAAQGRDLFGWSEDITAEAMEQCGFTYDVLTLVVVSGRRVVHGTDGSGNPTITADVVVLGSVLR